MVSTIRHDLSLSTTYGTAGKHIGDSSCPAAKRYKRVDRATAVIWKMLMIAQKKFRRLNALELLEKVYLELEVQYANRIEISRKGVAA
jgi:hypothetical protein